MDELSYVYATGGIIVAYFLARIATGRLDPFEAVWMYLVGYVQLYVIQPWSYHDWAVGVRGTQVVSETNWRALWALCWFLTVYHLNPFGLITRALPQPPRSWSPRFVAAISPPLILWGLFCAGMVARSADPDPANGSAEIQLLSAFPFVMMVAAILLIVTGRNMQDPRPKYDLAGLLTSAAYILIWTFNGKRSPSLIAVLTTLSAVYVTRMRRPSWTVLIATAATGILVVAVAIGWRMDREHPRTLSGFVSFLTDFDASRALVSLNIANDDEEEISHETEEYGGFLLMMDTVPEKSGYDYGANYLKAFSTFIPRLIWKDKPIYGRQAWVNAWIAGSEFKREENFASPAIGILGATQLNGGALATFIVIGIVGATLRSAYDYFRRHQDVPWAQFWWSVTYYNAWLMVVADDPLVWFYFSWGFSVFPIVILAWFANKTLGARQADELLVVA